ncbi:MAG: hypothetical protein M0Z31_04310 [Clostridia bacterium]|nr:hypothetical protein [Clostridia bacterium]
MTRTFITVHLVFVLLVGVLWYQPWISKIHRGERILNLKVKAYLHGQQKPVVWFSTSDKKQITKFIEVLGREEMMVRHATTELARSYQKITLEVSNAQGETKSYILKFKNNRPMLRAAHGEVEPWQKESYSPSVTLIRTLEAYHYQALGKGHLIRELQSEPLLVFNN